MKQIKNMINIIEKSQIRINNILFFSLLWFALCFVGQLFSIEGIYAVILVVLLIVVYFIFRNKNIFDYRSPKTRRIRSQKLKMLENNANQIEKELNEEATIKIFDKSLKFVFLLTKNRFVYIDAVHFEIRNVDEIDIISEELNTSSSRIHLSIKFKDNTFLYVRSVQLYDIETKIKINYPNIKIGSNLLNDSV